MLVRIIFVDPSLYFKMDDERTERKRKKDEQRGKVDAPQLSSSCASLAAAPATSGVGYLWPVTPGGSWSSHTKTTAAHTTVTAAIARTPTLRVPGSTLVTWFSTDVSTLTVAVTVAVVVVLGWVCLVSPLGVCSVLQSVQFEVRPVSLMTWCSNGISISSLRRAI